MKLGMLMIVMTMLEGGGLSAAFVNTASLDECERRAEGLRAILSSQNVPIKDLVCRGSEARFQPFSHGDGSGEAHRYVVTFDAQQAWVAPQAEGAPCDGAAAAASAPPDTIRYCATSTQKLLSEGN